MPTVQEVWQDPEFMQLHPVEKAKVMGQIDPEFKALPVGERHKVVFQLTERYATPGLQTQPEPFAPPAHDPNFGGVSLAGGSKPVSTLGIATPRQRQEAADLKQGFKEQAAPTISKAARPILEGGGAVGGAILAGAAATPETLGAGTIPAGVAGGALGFAGGKRVADALDIAMGLKAPQTATQIATDTVGDLGTGAMLEMGGQLAGKAIGAAVTKGSELVKTGLPWTDKRNTVNAGRRILEASTETTPPAPYRPLGDFGDSQFVPQPTNMASRQAETDALMKRIGAEVSPTPAQATGQTRLAALEQSQSTNPVMMERLKLNDAQINQAALANVGKNLGPDAAPLMSQGSAQQTGENIVAAITSAREPVKAAEREIWARVPNYPMPAENFATTAKTLQQTPLMPEARAAIENIMAYAQEMPKTVDGLHVVRKTIGDQIGKAQRAGDANTARVLTELKTSLTADFDALGAAAKNGDIALHNGEVVFPSKIQAELDRVKQEMLFPKGGGMLASSDAKILTDRAAQLVDTLTNLQPADDVAARFQAANKFSQEQNAQRFKVGAVKDVLQAGKQLTGYRSPAEAVPAKFFTPTGADDLIRAVGKPEAVKQMLSHATEQMTAKAVDANGVMNIPRAMDWIRQNQATIDRLGIAKNLYQTVKDQLPAAIRDQLSRAPVDVMGNPYLSARQASKILRDFAPAIKQTYGQNSGALKALQDYHKTLELLARNKNVSYAKGSTTAEKMGGVDLAADIASTALHGGGFLGSMARNIAGAIKSVATQHNKAQVNALLQDAIFDPTLAKSLMDTARGAKTAPVMINRALASMAPQVARQAVKSFTYQNGELIPDEN